MNEALLKRGRIVGTGLDEELLACRDARERLVRSQAVTAVPLSGVSEAPVLYLMKGGDSA
ncbi:hypothetical protein [Streptosporangium sp. H16]|uniref:hypothetical protein n=1 Tax=Streptosporangium sp. H16 TaxID=3444184 RepID=UPI003F7AA4CB